MPISAQISQTLLEISQDQYCYLRTRQVFCSRISFLL